jgi:hypothetical protein
MIFYRKSAISLKTSMAIRSFFGYQDKQGTISMIIARSLHAVAMAGSGTDPSAVTARQRDRRR